MRHSDSVRGARHEARTVVSHCLSLIASVQMRGLNSNWISSPAAFDALAAPAGDCMTQPKETRAHATMILPRLASKRVDRAHKDCLNVMLRHQGTVGDGASQRFIFRERIEMPFAGQRQCIPQFDERI